MQVNASMQGNASMLQVNSLKVMFWRELRFICSKTMYMLQVKFDFRLTIFDLGWFSISRFPGLGDIRNWEST